MKDKKPSGKHAFNVACTANAIEHRLAPPRLPQTNGMVQRFNGSISELLQKTRFDSAADLETTLLNYSKLYNHIFRTRNWQPVQVVHLNPEQLIDDQKEENQPLKNAA